jgi:hypothetical protein
MTDSSISSITRRQFISIAAAAMAAAALPAGDFALGQSSTDAVPQAASSHAGLDPDWANAGIIATRNSPYAKLKERSCAGRDDHPRLLVEAPPHKCGIKHSQHPFSFPTPRISPQSAPPSWAAWPASTENLKSATLR